MSRSKWQTDGTVREVRRAALFLTPLQLEKKFNIPVSTIRGWLRKKNPRRKL